MECKNAIPRPLNLKEAIEKLKREETSTFWGCILADEIRVAANARVEDDWSTGELTVGDSNWQYWGVFDGHK